LEVLIQEDATILSAAVLTLEKITL